MPNYCDNKLTITGPQGAVDALNHAALGPEGRISLEALSPYPKRVMERLVATDEEGLDPNSAEELRYQWRMANWGTARDVQLGHTEFNIPGHVQYVFRTAWEPVNAAFLRKITRDFPGIRAELSYAEPGCCFSGRTVARDGWITEESREPYDPMAGHDMEEQDTAAPEPAPEMGPGADLWLLAQQGMVERRVLSRIDPDRRTPLTWMNQAMSYTLYQDPSEPEEQLILMDPEPSWQAPQRALAELCRLAGVDIPTPAPENVWQDEPERQFTRLPRHMTAQPGLNGATDRAAAAAASHAADLEILLHLQGRQVDTMCPGQERETSAEAQALHQVRLALSLLERAVDIIHDAPQRAAQDEA